MKFLIAVVFVVLVGGAAKSNEPNQSIIRVLTYNIHHGEGTDGNVDLQRIADVIRRANPDFVALQEVDRNTQRTGGIDQTKQLAELTGMHGYFFRQIDFAGGEYGQAILSKSDLIERQQFMLPGEPEREQRLLARALFTVGGKQLWFATTHLHHADNDIREGQVAALNALFAKIDPMKQPAIVCGDFNAVPESQAMKTIAGAWTISGAEKNLPTFPAVKPTRQIDYVIVRGANEMRVISTIVLAEPLASDHCPLMVEIAITP